MTALEAKAEPADHGHVVSLPTGADPIGPSPPSESFPLGAVQETCQIISLPPGAVRQEAVGDILYTPYDDGQEAHTSTFYLLPTQAAEEASGPATGKRSKTVIDGDKTTTVGPPASWPIRTSPITSEDDLPDRVSSAWPPQQTLEPQRSRALERKRETSSRPRPRSGSSSSSSEARRSAKRRRRSGEHLRSPPADSQSTRKRKRQMPVIVPLERQPPGRSSSRDLPQPSQVPQNPFGSSASGLRELDMTEQYLFTPQEVVDYYGLDSVEDIQNFDSGAPYRFSVVRLNDVVMDVTDLDPSMQRAMLGVFPQAAQAWSHRSDTPEDMPPPVLHPHSLEGDSFHSELESDSGEAEVEDDREKGSSEARLLKDAVRILADRDPDLKSSLTPARAPLLVPHSKGSNDDMQDPDGGRRSRLPVNPDVLQWFGDVDASLKVPGLAKPNIPFVPDSIKHTARLFGFGHAPDSTQVGFLKSSRQPPLEFHQLSSYRDDADVARAMRSTIHMDAPSFKAVDSALLSGLATVSQLNFFARGARNDASELFHASTAFFKALRAVQSRTTAPSRTDLEKVYSAASAFATQETRIASLHTLTKACKLAAFYAVAPLTTIDANLCLLQRDKLLSHVASSLGDIRSKVRQSSVQQNRLFECEAVKQEARAEAQHQVHLSFLSSRSSHGQSRNSQRGRGPPARGRRHLQQQQSPRFQQRQQGFRAPFWGRGREAGRHSQRGQFRSRGRGRGGARASTGPTAPTSQGQ